MLVDESIFQKKEELIKELIQNGFEDSNIKVIIFRDKFNKNDFFQYPIFSDEHLSWSGSFLEPVINNFIDTKFDLLISFYDTEKTPLMLVTNQSRAKFKVGFATVDNRLNNLIIETELSDYKIFAHELFKYLKSFKKI